MLVLSRNYDVLGHPISRQARNKANRVKWEHNRECLEGLIGVWGLTSKRGRSGYKTGSVNPLRRRAQAHTYRRNLQKGKGRERQANQSASRQLTHATPTPPRVTSGREGERQVFHPSAPSHHSPTLCAVKAECNGSTGNSTSSCTSQSTKLNQEKRVFTRTKDKSCEFSSDELYTQQHPLRSHDTDSVLLQTPAIIRGRNWQSGE